MPAVAQCPDGTPPPCAGRAAHAANRPPSSVAVLYFDNVSRDTTEAYLADGITESLIDRLGAAGLRVASRFQVRRYRGAERLDPLLVGRTLGVAHLVSGSVRRVGNRVRISVELARAPGGARVWGRQFDRPADDLLAIETDIATAVADSIAGQLLPAQRAALSRRPTRDPAAYEHLLRGNYLMSAVSISSVERAMQEYEAAIGLDSSSVAAHARLAYAYSICAQQGLACRQLQRDSVVARGERIARGALRLDSSSADAWTAHSIFLTSLSPPRTRDALSAAQRAAALDPRNPDALSTYARLLMCSGDDSAAEATYRHALAVAPTQAQAHIDLAWLAMGRGQLGAARALLDSAVASEPQHSVAYLHRAVLRAHLGDTAGARGDAATHARLSGRSPLTVEAIMVLATAAAGDTVRASAMVMGLTSQLARDPSWYAKGPIAGNLPAWILARLGRYDEAVLALPEPGFASWLTSRYPEFDPIRSHPGFQAWVESARRLWNDR